MMTIDQVHGLFILFPLANVILVEIWYYMGRVLDSVYTLMSLCDCDTGTDDQNSDGKKIALR